VLDYTVTEHAKKPGDGVTVSGPGPLPEGIAANMLQEGDLNGAMQTAGLIVS